MPACATDFDHHYTTRQFLFRLRVRGLVMVERGLHTDSECDFPNTTTISRCHKNRHRQIGLLPG